MLIELGLSFVAVLADIALRHDIRRPYQQNPSTWCTRAKYRCMETWEVPLDTEASPAVQAVVLGGAIRPIDRCVLAVIVRCVAAFSPEQASQAVKDVCFAPHLLEPSMRKRIDDEAGIAQLRFDCDRRDIGHRLLAALSRASR